MVSDSRVVPSEVSQGPDGLLDNFNMLGTKQDYEHLNCTLVTKDLDMFVFSRSQVCHAPSRLKLKLWIVLFLDEFNEARDQACIYHCLQGRFLLEGQQSSESNSREDLLYFTFFEYQFEQAIEVSFLQIID